MINAPLEIRRNTFVMFLKKYNEVKKDYNLERCLNKIEAAKKARELVEAVEETVSYIKTTGNSKTIELLDKVLWEFRSYESLMFAIHYKHETAQKWFELSAEKGEVIRII